MAEALDLALAKANGEAMRGAQVLAGLRIHPQHAVSQHAEPTTRTPALPTWQEPRGSTTREQRQQPHSHWHADG